MCDTVDLTPLAAHAVGAPVPQAPPDPLVGLVAPVRDDVGTIVDWQLRTSVLLSSQSLDQPTHRSWATWRRSFRPSAELGPAAAVRSWPGWVDVHDDPTVPEALPAEQLPRALAALQDWRERHLEDPGSGVELRVGGAQRPRWRLPGELRGTLSRAGEAYVKIDDAHLWLSGLSGTRPLGEWEVDWSTSPVTVTVDGADVLDDDDEVAAVVGLAPSATSAQVRPCRTLQVWAPLVAGLSDVATAAVRAGGHVEFGPSETVMV